MKVPRTQRKPKVTILNRDDIKAIITEMPVNGFRLADWLKKQLEDTAGAVERAVREGLRAGDTQGQLAKRLNETLDNSVHHAEGLARTAVNQVKNDVKFETFEGMEELTTSYTWIAQLDSRTCPRCRPLDGKSFRYDNPKAPRPPVHVRCRCTIDSDIDWDDLGLEEPTIRRKADGAELEVIDADVSYEDWLKKQPKYFQEEVIKNPQKLEWFRRGKISLADMVKSDGSELSISELRKKISKRGGFHGND